MSSGDKLRALAEKKAGLDVDRDNYAAFVADCVEFCGWSDDDVTEYRDEVARVMKSGSDDEKRAAREFWELKALERATPAAGINQRIRAENEEDKRLAA